MDPDQFVVKFIQVLAWHRGLARAISVADMAHALGLGRDKRGQRKAQAIKRAVVEAGHLVGSSCGVSHGWYTPETPAELEATIAQYESRIRSLAILIRKTKGAAGFKRYLGQLAMDLEA